MQMRVENFRQSHQNGRHALRVGAERVDEGDGVEEGFLHFGPDMKARDFALPLPIILLIAPLYALVSLAANNRCRH